MPDPDLNYTTIDAEPSAIDASESQSQSTKTELATDAFVKPKSKPASSQRSAPAAESPPAGERYEVRSKLGSGAFGNVTLAWDRLLQREVAIKRPVAELDDHAKQSFLHEARLAAKVKHPGIVTVFDVGTDAQCNPYIVYEYFGGGTLRNLLDGKPLPLTDALQFGIAIGEALQAAHRAGLTHRDLKPANILLDQAGQPHIVDFGLAIDDAGHRLAQGEVAGTYRYMAPEQLRGESNQLDGRTDLWALGVMLYEMLTGQPPFQGKARSEMQLQVLTREPRPLRQLASQVPLSVQQIVLKLLAKQLADRYSSAADVIADLRRELEIAVASSTSHAEHLNHAVTPLQRTISRGVVLAVVIAAVALTIGAFSGVAWFITQLAKPAPMTASPATPAPPVLTKGRGPFSDAEYPPGNWLEVLQPERDPGEIIFSTKARREWSKHRELMLESRWPAFLELGNTTAENYSLELECQMSDWKGNAGLFLGYSPVDSGTASSERQRDSLDHLAAATLVTVDEAERGTIKLDAKRIELGNSGAQVPNLLETANLVARSLTPPEDRIVTMMVEVERGRITRFYLNNSQLTLADQQEVTLPCRGKFGVYVLGGAGTFRHCRIRITP